MKNKISVIMLMAALLTLDSCKKELQKINKNPNNLENPDPASLLSNVIVSEFYNNSWMAWTLGNGYSQQMTFSSSYYNQPTRYYPVTNEPYWIVLYEAARDANIIYQQGVSKNNAFMQATGLTLRSYAFAQLTELWGDIPFTQSIKGTSGNYTPSYDSQQTVYTDAQMGILASLRTADNLLQSNPNATMGGDLLFNSNVASWRRFINALRLRYLLRVSGKMSVSAEMQSIVTGGNIMNSASQSAALTLITTPPYAFTSLTERSGDFAVKYMDTLLYNVFVTTQDTIRTSNYFAVIPGTASGAPFSFANYGGMPMVSDATGAQTSKSSNFNATFRSGSAPALIKSRLITYAEQEFILAEASLMGYIADNPQTHYNNGVMGAYAEMGFSTTSAASYLAHDSVAYNNSSQNSSLRQIITQKWMLNINNGFEGWIEWKRTGYPALSPGGNLNLNNGKIALRFRYPISESTVNTTNYNNEIQKMGGSDNTIYSAWW